MSEENSPDKKKADPPSPDDKTQKIVSETAFTVKPEPPVAKPE